jgi:alcohol dehydrogenase
MCGGICNTDLELQRGYYGFRGTPGHEFVGEVVAADDRALIGKRVVGEINLACGECEWCRRGLGRHCPTRTVLGIVNHPGAFSEFFTLPERNLHVVPDEIPTERAVFTEPVAAACEILDQVEIAPGLRAAVLGVGKLGSLVAQVLEDAGARVVRVGRRDRARNASFELVVECTGSPAGMPRALDLIRPRGTIVWKSTHHAPAHFDAAPLVVNEITVIGSRCGRFEPAIERLREHRISVRPLISAEFPLSRARQALAAAARPGARKILLRPDPAG